MGRSRSRRLCSVGRSRSRSRSRSPEVAEYSTDVSALLLGGKAAHVTAIMDVCKLLCCQITVGKFNLTVSQRRLTPSEMLYKWAVFCHMTVNRTTNEGVAV